MSRLSPREKPCFDLGNWMQLVWNSLTQNRYGNHTPSCLLSWQSLTGLSGPVLAELERIKPSKPSSCCRQMTLPWAPLPARPRESCPHPQTPRQATWMLSTGVDGKGGAKLGLVASVRGGDASSVLIQLTYSAVAPSYKYLLQLLSSRCRVCPCLQLSQGGCKNKHSSKYGYPCLL